LDPFVPEFEKMTESHYLNPLRKANHLSKLQKREEWEDYLQRQSKNGSILVNVL
jgi:hypothetical protein